jgi:hypothetical protein
VLVKVLAWYDNEWGYSCRMLDAARAFGTPSNPAVSTPRPVRGVFHSRASNIIMQVKKLTDLDVKGKRVFIRADLNVPQDDAGNITEDTRIRASIPSIKYALEGGAAVMVTSTWAAPPKAN